MRAISAARRSSVAVRAGANRPRSDKRGVFELCSTSLAKPVTLQEVATAYYACHLMSGAERLACYIANDLDGHMVEKWFLTVERLERYMGPPPSIARRHLDSARDALFQLLPPSDSPLPDDFAEDSDDTM